MQSRKTEKPHVSAETWPTQIHLNPLNLPPRQEKSDCYDATGFQLSPTKRPVEGRFHQQGAYKNRVIGELANKHRRASECRYLCPVSQAA